MVDQLTDLGGKNRRPALVAWVESYVPTWVSAEVLADLIGHRFTLARYAFELGRIYEREGRQ